MIDPTRREATYQDVLDAPEHMVAEIIDGELILSPRPAGPHSSVASVVGGELLPPFSRGRGGPGGWIILDEPELHFGKRIVVPDLHEGKWLTVAVFADDDKVRAEPFDAIELDLTTLWADLPVRASEPAAEYGDSVW